MTSPLPPRIRDSRGWANLERQDRTRLNQLDHGLVGGRFSPARPVKPAFNDDGEDDVGDDLILFSNTDTGVAAGSGLPITIKLSHVPEDGSEQVYYNGTPLKRTDWSRTDSVLTIPGEVWFHAGDIAWVDYAYYDEEPDTETPALVNYTLVNGNQTSIAVPSGTSPGNLMILVLAARDNVGCSDSRFDAGYHDGQRGVWTGVSDGSGAPVAITLDSTATDGGVDDVGILATFNGSPLALTADLGSTGTAAPFNPADPTGGTFGMAGVAMSSGLLSGLVTDENTSTWTTVVRTGGFGAGKSSAYVGYNATGTPAGTWNTTGGVARWVARIVGVQ